MKDRYYYLLFILLATVFFWKLFVFPGTMIYSEPSDIISVHMVYGEIKHSIFQAGMFPLWNPFSISFGPFIADPQGSSFYPWSFLNGVFNPNTLFGYEIWLHVILSGVFMFLFLRNLNSLFKLLLYNT